jgi:hydrogenase maturation protease
MTASVVVFAVGNPSRGDDAIGPILCGQLEKWLENSGLAGEVELIEDFQLNIEHALDLVDRQLALFIDAGHATPGPFTLTRTLPAPFSGHSTHALEPAAVLAVFESTMNQSAPPAYTLCVRGEMFELGQGLSAAAEANLRAAMGVSERLMEARSLCEWEVAAANCLLQGDCHAVEA